MKKRKLLFILEGENREIEIFKNITSIFFNNTADIIPICVPAEMNIYMLYSILKKDNFETDIIEILKERIDVARNILNQYTRNDFAEIYYFFDFDEHSNNLSKNNNLLALQEMLQNLNNETELGKLYISYPMIEALRDYTSNNCKTISGSCFRNRNEFNSYKEDSSKNKMNNDFNKYNFINWKNIIESFVYRTSCLFNLKYLDRSEFINLVTPISIYNKECCIYKLHEKVFILSCIPEFLIDYSEKYWNVSIKNKKEIHNNYNCEDKIKNLKFKN